MMTMKVNKGLEFSAVALAGLGHIPAKGEDEKEAAWVFFWCQLGFMARKRTFNALTSVDHAAQFSQCAHVEHSCTPLL